MKMDLNLNRYFTDACENISKEKADCQINGEIHIALDMVFGEKNDEGMALDSRIEVIGSVTKIQQLSAILYIAQSLNFTQRDYRNLREACTQIMQGKQLVVERE